jgi:hypothetical protein
MMKQVTQNMQIVGKLYAEGLEFDLLQLTPAERFAQPTYLRNDALPFYVRDPFGQATYVVVKGNFVIWAYPRPVEMPVTLFLEEDEEVPVAIPV